MNGKTFSKIFLHLVALLWIILFFAKQGKAHCDTMDGPVVKEAERALTDKDVTPVLKWIRKEDEPQVRLAFKKTLTVRSKGREAKEIADRYFFETLVRLHRASEGEPFTGLKPTGSQEPSFIEADRSLETGSIDFLVGHLTTEIETGIRRRFKDAIEKRAHKHDNVEAGRNYVAAYVSFLHYLERLMAVIPGQATPHHESEQP